MKVVIFKWLYRLRIALDKKMLRHGFIPRSLKLRYAANPLLKYPRNYLCWCGSRRKAKACCLPTQSKAVMMDQAKILTEYVHAVKNA